MCALCCTAMCSLILSSVSLVSFTTLSPCIQFSKLFSTSACCCQSYPTCELLLSGKTGSQIIVPYDCDPYFAETLKVVGDLGQVLFYVSVIIINYYLLLFFLLLILPFSLSMSLFIILLSLS